MKTGTILRISRPTESLEDVVRFYTEGLGLSRLGSFENHEGFDGVMLGLPETPYHLEFTRKRGDGSAPGKDQLLVFYLPDAAEWRAAVGRLAAAGHRPVASFNPYWDRAGCTFEDPDGCRVVLQNETWRA
jgi:catechol 2,3-dioxygenase-like lactoylglutathione lyase family enzyme